MRPLRVVALAAVVACAAHAADAQTPPPVRATPAAPASSTADTNAAGLIPAGFGTLRQDNLAIRLELPDLIVRIIPLDESVIRTLSPDSYRALRGQVESHRALLTRLATQHGLQRASVWYVEFFGLAPDARFSPEELTITSGGREFRPVEVVPLSTGFGSQHLQPRDRQTALYLFDDAVDVNQPLTVTFSGQTSAQWESTLRDVERERALIRSRARMP